MSNIHAFCGLIRDVTWDLSTDPRQDDTLRLDLHVIDQIPCAVILDKWLLWDHKAFIRYAYRFIDIGF